MEDTKPKRGQKKCPKCTNINGARAHVCKHCGHTFVSKNTQPRKEKRKRVPKVKKYEKVADWMELDRGDKIKVLRGSGNFYVNESGERQYLTEPGIYTVCGFDDNGLMVYNGGYSYLYMGPEQESNTLSHITRSPHRLLKVNPTLHPRLM